MSKGSVAGVSRWQLDSRPFSVFSHSPNFRMYKVAMYHTIKQQFSSPQSSEYSFSQVSSIFSRSRNRVLLRLRSQSFASSVLHCYQRLYTSATIEVTSQTESLFISTNILSSEWFCTTKPPRNRTTRVKKGLAVLTTQSHLFYWHLLLPIGISDSTLFCFSALHSRTAGSAYHFGAHREGGKLVNNSTFGNKQATTLTNQSRESQSHTYWTKETRQKTSNQETSYQYHQRSTRVQHTSTYIIRT